jgi:hypothetical protein
MRAGNVARGRMLACLVYTALGFISNIAKKKKKKMEKETLAFKILVCLGSFCLLAFTSFWKNILEVLR